MVIHRVPIVCHQQLQCLVDTKFLGTHQGPVVRSLVSASRWLRGIKTYRFPWYLTLVSANHASSNPGQMTHFSDQWQMWNFSPYEVRFIHECISLPRLHVLLICISVRMRRCTRHNYSPQFVCRGLVAVFQFWICIWEQGDEILKDIYMYVRRWLFSVNKLTCPPNILHSN